MSLAGLTEGVNEQLLVFLSKTIEALVQWHSNLRAKRHSPLDELEVAPPLPPPKAHIPPLLPGRVCPEFCTRMSRRHPPIVNWNA